MQHGAFKSFSHAYAATDLCVMPDADDARHCVSLGPDLIVGIGGNSSAGWSELRLLGHDRFVRHWQLLCTCTCHVETQTKDVYNPSYLSKHSVEVLCPCPTRFRCTAGLCLSWRLRVCSLCTASCNVSLTATLSSFALLATHGSMASILTRLSIRWKTGTPLHFRYLALSLPASTGIRR